VAEEYQGDKLVIGELKLESPDCTNKNNKQIKNNYNKIKKWEKE